MSVWKIVPLFGAVCIRQGGRHLHYENPFTFARKIYENFKILRKDIVRVQKITNDLPVMLYVRSESFFVETLDWYKNDYN